MRVKSTVRGGGHKLRSIFWKRWEYGKETNRNACRTCNNPSKANLAHEEDVSTMDKSCNRTPSSVAMHSRRTGSNACHGGKAQRMPFPSKHASARFVSVVTLVSTIQRLSTRAPRLGVHEHRSQRRVRATRCLCANAHGCVCSPCGKA